MNAPRKPADPPAEGAPSDADPAGKTPQGIPEGIEDAEAKGTPTSDRNESEHGPHTT